jgi:hypothetical protein
MMKRSYSDSVHKPVAPEMKLGDARKHPTGSVHQAPLVARGGLNAHIALHPLRRN